MGFRSSERQPAACVLEEAPGQCQSEAMSSASQGVADTPLHGQDLLRVARTVILDGVAAAHASAHEGFYGELARATAELVAGLSAR